MPVSLRALSLGGQNSTVMMAEVVVVIPPPGLVMPCNRLQVSVFRWLGRDWWFLIKTIPEDALVIRSLVQFPISINSITYLPISQAWPSLGWLGAGESAVISISLLPSDPST